MKITAPIISFTLLALAVPGSPVLAQSPATQEAAPGAQAPGADGRPAARKPRRTDRIFARDLEGLWVNTRYVEALKATRSPLDAARKAPPIVVKVEKKGPSYPMLRTDFDRAVLLRIIDVQPEDKPGAFRVVLAEDDMRPVLSSEVTTISFRGRKAEQERFSALAIAEPIFGRKKFQDFQRVEEGIAPLVNEVVIAGSYKDASGAVFSFSRTGEAQLPDGKFSYELRLSARGADCSVLESVDDGSGAARRRIGFRWRGTSLELLDVQVKGADSLRCGARPVAVLTPQ